MDRLAILPKIITFINVLIIGFITWYRTPSIVCLYSVVISLLIKNSIRSLYFHIFLKSRLNQSLFEGNY